LWLQDDLFGSKIKTDLGSKRAQNGHDSRIQQTSNFYFTFFAQKTHVKPQNNLTRLFSATSPWRISYPWFATIKTGRKDKAARQMLGSLSHLAQANLNKTRILAITPMDTGF